MKSTSEWFTPSHIIDAARKVMGSIELDPASCAEANEVVKADRYYTKEQNGLLQPWYAETLWVNPPYNMPEVAQFTREAVVACQHLHVGQAMILVNNATDAAWFQYLLSNATVCFLKGRIKFWGPQLAASAGTPRQGQAIFYMGSRHYFFHEEFSKLGVVLVRY